VLNLVVIVPAHPSALTVLAPGAIAKKMAATICSFEHNKTEYEIYITIMVPLEPQILAAVDPIPW
jgi:hypothetical protein